MLASTSSRASIAKTSSQSRLLKSVSPPRPHPLLEGEGAECAYPPVYRHPALRESQLSSPPVAVELQSKPPLPEGEGAEGIPARILVLALLILGILSGAARAAEPAEPSPHTTFYHANALYKDGQYQAAAEEYEELRQAGLASGNLYFNLGNAYFKAGEKGKAILNYERARRLIPGDPDLAANLAYAQSLTGAEACSPALWQAVAFPLSHRLATHRLVWTTSAMYTLLLLALAGYRLWPARPRWLVYTATGLAMLVLITSTSLAQQVLTDDCQLRAVVISSGDAPTRFEPAESGTVHFVLKEGSLVRVVETRDNWIEVARCDGRRGWIEKSAIDEL